MATGADPRESLSPRRREVLELVAKGLTNAEIGSVLGISEGTVRTHVSAVLSQLEVTNRTEAAALFQAAESSSQAFWGRPTVAVLPFDTDPDGERVSRAFATGLSDELIALLAQWAWFPVIARSSSLDAGPGGDPHAAGRALGATFLVTGRIRRVADRIRVQVFVDDVSRGECIWSDRHDLDERELFAMQDEVSGEIVGRMYPQLFAAAAARRRDTASQAALSAWELMHAGMLEYARRAPAANVEARRLFEMALAKDDRLMLAYFGRGLTFYQDVQNQWGPRDRAIEQMASCVASALQEAPGLAGPRFLQARLEMARGDFRASVPHLEEAIRLNPSFADAYAALGQAKLVALGDGDGIELMRHAARLSPRVYVAGLGIAQFAHGNYDEALRSTEEALVARPAYTFARIIAIASAVWLDDEHRGRQHLALLLEHQPEFRASAIEETFRRHHFDTIARVIEALRRLGFTR